MPLLNEYLRLRTDQNRELTWSELDDNFLYVANAWSPERIYKEGNIVYKYDATDGYAWWIATSDNGPSASFDIADWSTIGASGGEGTTVGVKNGNAINYGINLLDFNSGYFTVSIVGSTANIQTSGALVKYWLEQGDASIGTGQNAAAAIHTGNIVIGSGSFENYKLTVHGTTNITGNLTLGGNINNVDIAAFASAYTTHTHTAVNSATFPSYSATFPLAVSTLADFDINSNTLAQGHTLSWNNSTKRWVNIASSTGSLAGLSDVLISSASDNQILRYEAATSKWKNVTVATSGDTGFSTAPLSHNHDTRYYTKSQLNTAGTSNAVHWDNIGSKPTDTATYLMTAVPTNSPFTKTNYRVIGSSDNSITLTTGANTLDLTVNAAALTPSFTVQRNGSNSINVRGFNFVDTDSIVNTITLVGTNAQISSVSRHAYYNGTTNVLLANQSSSEFITPSTAGANLANVSFIVTEPGNSRARIIATARPAVSINSTIQPSLRQIINYADTATIEWSIVDNGAGADSYTLTADFVGATSSIVVEFGGTPVSGGPFGTIDFVNSGSATWNITSPSSGNLEVSVDSSIPGLQAVTDVSPDGNKTTNNLEITTPADTANGVGGLILTSPDGTKRFLLTVTDTGALLTTQLP
jgi:hypothetical protein